MVVREAEERDSQYLTEIVREAMPDRVPYVLAALAKHEVLVAQDEEAITGCLVWNREFFGRPFCWLLIVNPAHRRRGHAQMLLVGLENRCRGERVYISTNKSNAAMHRLLARRGYDRRGEVDLDPSDPEAFYSKDVNGSVLRGGGDENDTRHTITKR